MANPIFPTLRKYYPGIDNPLFLGDITTADSGILSALSALSGAVSGDFFIISGLEYTLGTPNTYTPGIVYFNDDFFYCPTLFNEGLYLATTYVDVLLETFDDTVARDIYINQVATATSTSAGSTPAFTGNMNQYRLNNKYLQQKIVSILSITGALGTTAFTDLGTGTGQVLTADQTYTQAQVNSLLLTRAPSCIGCEVTVHDFDGTFPANFNGSGLGIVYPWFNSLTGERWGIMNGTAAAGGNTAPNMAGKTTIGQGTDAGSNTFTEGTTYGANTLTLLANNIPVLKTENIFNNGAGGTNVYASGTGTPRQVDVNAASPNTPINTMQSSLAVYKVVRLA